MSLDRLHNWEPAGAKNNLLPSLTESRDLLCMTRDPYPTKSECQRIAHEPLVLGFSTFIFFRSEIIFTLLPLQIPVNAVVGLHTAVVVYVPIRVQNSHQKTRGEWLRFSLVMSRRKWYLWKRPEEKQLRNSSSWINRKNLTKQTEWKTWVPFGALQDFLAYNTK